MTNNSVSYEQEYRHVTIALKPEVIERLEAARVQLGMRTRSAVVALLLEEVLLGDEQTDAVG